MNSASMDHFIPDSQLNLISHGRTRETCRLGVDAVAYDQNYYKNATAGSLPQARCLTAQSSLVPSKRKWSHEISTQVIPQAVSVAPIGALNAAQTVCGARIAHAFIPPQSVRSTVFWLEDEALTPCASSDELLQLARWVLASASRTHCNTNGTGSADSLDGTRMPNRNHLRRKVKVVDATIVDALEEEAVTVTQVIAVQDTISGWGGRRFRSNQHSQVEGAPEPMTAEEALKAAEEEALDLQPTPHTAGRYRGVSYEKHKIICPYRAKAYEVLNGQQKTLSLGCFATAEEAALAFARHNRDKDFTCGREGRRSLSCTRAPVASSPAALPSAVEVAPAEIQILPLGTTSAAVGASVDNHVYEVQASDVQINGAFLHGFSNPQQGLGVYDR